MGRNCAAPIEVAHIARGCRRAQAQLAGLQPDHHERSELTARKRCSRKVSPQGQAGSPADQIFQRTIRGTRQPPSTALDAINTAQSEIDRLRSLLVMRVEGPQAARVHTAGRAGEILASGGRC
jgi:hypothetical protein